MQCFQIVLKICKYYLKLWSKDGQGIIRVFFLIKNKKIFLGNREVEEIKHYFLIIAKLSFGNYHYYNVGGGKKVPQFVAME